MSLIYVMRHGRTAMNERGCLQGRTECPLNEAGREQAKKAGEILRENGINITHVYSSPLQRPIETAEIATGIDRREFALDERLIEMGFGDYEGTPVSSLPSEEMDRFFASPDEYPTPNGEKGSEVVSRVRDFLNELKNLDEAGKLHGLNLVSTHGGVMHAMRLVAENLTIEHYWDVDVHNCEIFSIDLLNGFEMKVVFQGFAPYFSDKNVTNEKYRG